MAGQWQDTGVKSVLPLSYPTARCTGVPTFSSITIKGESITDPNWRCPTIVLSLSYHCPIIVLPLSYHCPISQFGFRLYSPTTHSLTKKSARHCSARLGRTKAGHF